MPLSRRLDHIIICARDRKPWLACMDAVLALRPT